MRTTSFFGSASGALLFLLTSFLPIQVPAAAGASAPDAAPGVRAGIGHLEQILPGFHSILLPARGDLVLTPDQAVTAEALRDKPVDPAPPHAGARPAKPYPSRMTDSYPSGKAPYIAPGIRPFRFKWFHNEFNYGGWHNWGMTDYAALHGFDVLSAYNHTPETWRHEPPDTRWIKWGGFVNWEKWMASHDIPEGRFDRLAQMPLADILRKEQALPKFDPAYAQLMIDIEHGVLPPEKLRQQPWYPRKAGTAQRAEFEQAYYRGYARSYTAPVEAARALGWRNISLYGWQPFPRTYWGIAKAKKGARPWQWDKFGQSVYRAVDIINPSVYCFYWSSKNVAYTLVNIDRNMDLVREMPNTKPVRPYFWTLLHGGGGGRRWWRNQPLPTEDVRAMTTLAFFTGIDGIVQWNWSGTGNHHRPPPLKPDTDVMVGRPFRARPENAAGPAPPAREFRRYDVLHILGPGPDGSVRFQRIDKEDPRGKYGTGSKKTVYRLPAEDLRDRLRPKSEAVRGVVEGLVVVKPFEALLKFGTAIPLAPNAAASFKEDLPVVRCVRYGPWYLIASYDPKAFASGRGRNVLLRDFAGRTGLDVTVPADAQTRLFLLEVPTQPRRE
ncbi:MAG: hypothetical protein GXP31_00470 [Kiritimatiellaeota bacterium]|nr:hypothetical protein [Kiritimatiellota bacterium]